MYEVNQNNGETQCWIGLNKMMENPSGNRCPHCFDKCFAKEISITPVQIREEKFISSNDVVSTIITTDRYLLLVLTYALSTYLHRGVVPGGAGGAMTPQDFCRSVSPISTREEDYGHHIMLATRIFGPSYGPAYIQKLIYYAALRIRT